MNTPRALAVVRALLRYGWALPATAVGLALAVIVCALGAQIALVEGVVEVAGGRIGRAVSRLPRGSRFCAITLGHVVIATDRAALARCRAHERVHVHQYERWGVLFFPLYLGSSLQQLLCGRSPYWHNRFELEARRESSDPARPAPPDWAG